MASEHGTGAPGTTAASGDDERPAVSVVLPPSGAIAERARAAEALGCRRLWLYDSPALYTDLWVALARAAEATETIGMGTGVAVPSLRHPMVTASAIATIEELAPGRLVAAFGTGFTARVAMGRKAMRWDDLATSFLQVRGLLAGEVVEIDGRPCQMVHAGGWAPARPIRTPLWLAPVGPKGFGVAERVQADGVMLVGPPAPGQPRFSSTGLLVHGAVLGPGEDHTAPRVVDAAGPWFAATTYHSTWEMAPDALDAVPGGAVWREGVEALGRPIGEQHLAVHEGHITVLTDRDREGLVDAGAALLQSGWTGTPDEVRGRFLAAAEAGVTEVVYAPTGPDPMGELERFMEAVAR